MERILGVLLAPLWFVWGFAGPVTFILSVVHTWQTNASVAWKLFMNFTVDAIAAAFWPAAWLLWSVRHYVGQDTPLRLVFG
jgi:hypothetical protein